VELFDQPAATAGASIAST